MPALRALRRQQPESPLVLAGHGPAARLLADLGEAQQGRPFDDPELGWVFGAGEVPAAHFRRVVAWITTPDEDLRARLARASQAQPLVAPARPGEATHQHAAAHLLASVGGPSVWDTRGEAPLGVEALDAGGVLVHPGSGAPRKNWPAARFAAVIAALQPAGLHVSLVVGEADEQAAADVERTLGRPLERLRLALPTLARHLAGCRAYLGNDSGVTHLAGLCGAPTVALFGPTDPTVWGPLGPRVEILSFDTPPPRVAGRLLAAAH